MELPSAFIQGSQQHLEGKGTEGMGEGWHGGCWEKATDLMGTSSAEALG